MALGTVNVGRPLDPTKYVEAALLASPNGVATLDAEGKVPVEQLPAGSTQEGIQQSINEATKEFVTGTQMNSAITEATKDFVTDTEMGTAITEATKDHVTGEDVQKSINEATKDFVTGTDVDDKITEKTKDFATTEEVQQAVSDALNSDEGSVSEVAQAAVDSHNADETAHQDIRDLIDNLVIGLMKGTLSAPLLSQDGQAILTRDGVEILAVKNL